MSEADSAKNETDQKSDREFLRGLTRAFAGAIIFSIPMLMTMEMWHLGFHAEKQRLALLMFLAVPLLVGLSYYIGFEDNPNLLDDIIDAFVAYAVGFIASALILLIFSIIDLKMSAGEVIGKISIQAVVGAIGAMLAQSELGGEKKSKKKENRKKNTEYSGELFLMIVGAVFLALNLAPTEEMILISYKMSDASNILLALLSIALMHAFVYTVGFHGQEERMPEGSSFLSIFLRYTITGYALVMLISFYLLWTFGRIDGLSLEEIVKVVVVLGFPAALGAAASRLIL